LNHIYKQTLGNMLHSTVDTALCLWSSELAHTSEHRNLGPSDPERPGHQKLLQVLLFFRKTLLPILSYYLILCGHTRRCGLGTSGRGMSPRASGWSWSVVVCRAMQVLLIALVAPPAFSETRSEATLS